MDHKNILRSCIYLIFFPVLVNVIAGNDVITFNQDKDLSAEENIDTLLEKEQFIKVDGRRGPQPKTLQGNPQRDTSALKQDAESPSEASSKLSPSTQTPGSVNSKYKTRVAMLVRSNCSHSSNGAGSNHAPHLKWEDLSRMSELEDDFLPDLDYTFLPLNDEPSEQRLSRSRRQAPPLIEGSGDKIDITVDGSITFSNGTLSPNEATEGSPENIALKTKIRKALIDFLKRVTGRDFGLNIKTLRKGSIIVDFELLASEDSYNSIIQVLANAFSTLVNQGVLQVDSTYYSVKDPFLSYDYITKPVICFLCKPYQECKKKLHGNLYTIMPTR